ncbi:MAG TPA: PH domain-containing protein [Blastocatellia bacterium]|nr:PH domain-containing protein [Blastocatellia bacterium]
MFCLQCGNNLASESLFCNRCGAKAPNQRGADPRRAGRPSPPRPARRAPITPAPDQESFEKYEEDYPERGDGDYREDVSGKEQVIFSITPAFFEVLPSYLLAVALSLIVTAAVAYARGPLVFALIGAAIFFIRPFIRHARLKRTVYTLTNTKLEIRTGILSKDTKNIPLRHIDNVEVSETLKERLIGIGDVLIDSAALDSKMVMDNIKNPRKYADLIMDQLQNWN